MTLFYVCRLCKHKCFFYHSEKWKSVCKRLWLVQLLANKLGLISQCWNFHRDLIGSFTTKKCLGDLLTKMCSSPSALWTNLRSWSVDPTSTNMRLRNRHRIRSSRSNTSLKKAGDQRRSILLLFQTEMGCFSFDKTILLNAFALGRAGHHFHTQDT